MKRVLKYIHVLVTLALFAYLAWAIYTGSVGEIYTSAVEWFIGLSPIIVLLAVLFTIRKPGLPYQKWLIIVGGLVLLLVSEAVYTDSTLFFGSDITKLYAAITIFLSLFGIFTNKIVVAKGEYGKKAQIIEV